jgi:hypothetical protein
MKTRPANRSGRALLVLGMHRSGTSAVARVVNLLGAEIGSELVPPGPDNAKGFWEHAEAVRINDDLLHDLGRTWHDMRDMPEGWVDSPHARSAVCRIGELIERDFATAELCAVKDPRMCLTAPVWIEAFEKNGFEVACLFVVRDPREVVESLHRRNDWPRASLYLMWVQYLMEAAAASGARPRAMLSYDQLLSDWCSSMSRVALDLHLRWPVATEGGIADSVDAFLDASHRHHPAPPEKTGGEDESMPDLAARLYQTCLEVASGEGRWEAISERQDSYRAIAQLYGAHVDHLHAGRWDAEGRAQTANARLAEQAAVTTVVREAVQGLHEKLDGSVRQLQDEISALFGETAARLERQREGIMAVEARIQRQHALLNTISLRLEQAVHFGGTERAGTGDAPAQIELQKLQSALATSNAAVAALLASTSWKLTAPMRWLSVHLLRRPADLSTVAVEPQEQDAADARLEAIIDRPGTGGAAAAAGSNVADATTALDRCDGGPEPMAFRWM